METLDRGDANADEITYSALVQALRDGKVALVDVREQNEWDAGHVEGATLHPLSRFDPAQLPRGMPIVLICRSGNRSMTALQSRPRRRLHRHLALQGRRDRLGARRRRTGLAFCRCVEPSRHSRESGNPGERTSSGP